MVILILILLIFIVVAGVLLFGTGSRKIRTRRKQGSARRDLPPYPNHVVPGPFGDWILNPGSTFPLSVYGVSEADAQQTRNALEREDEKALNSILARLQIRCREIDQYIFQFRPKYRKALGRLV